jgi:hypothetical protein
MMRWLWVAASGALVCTVCDHLHATYGATAYARPVVWNQAWWVPLLFSLAVPFIVFLAGPTRRLLGGEPLPMPTARQIVGDGIQFVTAYVFTAFAHEQGALLTGVMLGWWVGRAVRGAPAWVAVYAIFVGLGGALFEAGWSGIGMFHHNHRDVLGVPFWLPMLYMHGALLAAPVERLVAGGP